MRTRVQQPQDPAEYARFCLMLPREAVSIPVVRQVLGDALSRVGLDQDCIADLLLALTEACTNVIKHAGPGQEMYEVVARIGRNRCVLQVLDNGRGFSPARIRISHSTHLRRPPVRPVQLLGRRARNADIARLAESGRGLAIMRACVDDVRLHSGPGRGTVVQLRKRIEWRQGAPVGDPGDWALRDAG
jgi:serine/threonine-protein kinase RsbW